MEHIFSLFLGYLASYLQDGKGKELSSYAKFWISVLASIMVGSLTVIVEILNTGDFDSSNFFAYLGMAFLASQARYNSLKEERKI